MPGRCRRDLFFLTVRELRKQNGFGFLWGPQIAKKLKAVAEVNEQKRTQAQKQPAMVNRRSIKVEGLNFVRRVGA